MTKKVEIKQKQRKSNLKRRMSQINTAVNRLTQNFKRLNIPKDMFNVGTITNTNNRLLTVRLSRKVIDELKEIYKKTWTERVEYAGVIPFTVKNTRNYVFFNKPTARTNQQFATVNLTQEELTQYIVYHTHPVPESNAPLFTLPSDLDLKVYVQAYPAMQANIILENQGYYIIDLIETNMNKPNINNVINLFKKLITGERFRRIEVSWDTIGYSRTTRDQWVKFINNYIDPIMRKQFGISIRYYTWNELGKITLLDKNVIMNIG